MLAKWCNKWKPGLEPPNPARLFMPAFLINETPVALADCGVSCLTNELELVRETVLIFIGLLVGLLINWTEDSPFDLSWLLDESELNKSLTY